jgi:hypothetical protein
MNEPADETAPPPPPPPEEKPRRAIPTRVIAALAGVLIVIAVIVASLFWGPPVMRALHWGAHEKASEPTKPTPQAAAPTPEAAKPAPQAAAPAPDPAIAAVKAQATQNAAALQQLSQRIAALEGRPTPQPTDLGPIEQQLGALAKTTADLQQSVAALDKAAQVQPATDPKNTALALILLQIREAVDLGRPFGAEYQALRGLTGERHELADAAAPLADPAESGVASRAVLAERLRQLAPQIATAAAPPSHGWSAQVAVRLRGLVTIRRVAGADQSPAEAAVGDAQHELAAGDLAGAAAALDRLDGANRAVAEPWLKMAKDRLAVEAALHQLQTALAASLGAAVPGKS